MKSELFMLLAGVAVIFLGGPPMSQWFGGFRRNDPPSVDMDRIKAAELEELPTTKTRFEVFAERLNAHGDVRF